MSKSKGCKTLCSAVLLSVVTSASLCGTAKALPANANDGSLNAAGRTVQTAQKLNVNERKCDTVNMASANEEKIIEMLKKDGTIPQDATLEEAHKAFIEYMKTMTGEEYRKMTGEEKKLESTARENVKKNNGIATFAAAKEDDPVTKVEELVVLVDYQDLKHDTIKEGETDMYYKDYSTEHFQNMLYGDNGYKGPNGEDFYSMKQYYDQQSGGTVQIDGTVTKWYTVDKPAAYYGAEQGSSHDCNAQGLVKDALAELAKDPTINLADYDKLDRYDLDGDGDYNEPDGIIDYLIVIHAGIGQEAGGGSVGKDAIWSHSSSLGGLYPIAGTSYTDENGKTRPYYAYKYTMDPEDGASGVFEHETGHELGLPDEYDTVYSSDEGEPISYWSIMSGGSWAGSVPGAEAPGFSPYGKQMFQELYGGNWQKQTVVNYDDLDSKGTKIKLNAAAKNSETVRINLPDVENILMTPTSGSYAYYGGRGKDGTPIHTNMLTGVDLTNAKNPTLTFKTTYDIELGWDFATVNVSEAGKEEWKAIKGNITTTEHDPQALVIVDNGITGTSKGWVDAQFDLSEYAGKNIDLKFAYDTDPYSFGQGIYIDDIKVADGETAIFTDDAEKEDAFMLEGFTRDDGKESSTNYYLIEWRDHSGVDIGLDHIRSGKEMFSYDPGMLVWYVNDFYSDNWTAKHPGHGYLSIVDADQKNVEVVQGEDHKVSLAINKYQMHDAAFSQRLGSIFAVHPSEGRKVVDYFTFPNSKFSDKKDYTNKQMPMLGVDLPKLDLNISILRQAFDNSNATIKISKGQPNSWWNWDDLFNELDDMMDDVINSRWHHNTTPMWE